MRLAYDEPALGARPRCGLNRDVPPRVVVVDQPIVLLPVHVLRWCGALEGEGERERDMKYCAYAAWHFVCKLPAVVQWLAKLTFSIMQTRLIVEPMSTCSSPEPSMNASGTTT